MPSAPATGKALGLHRGLPFAVTDLSEAEVVLRFRPNRRYVVTGRDSEPLSKRTDTVSVFINLALGMAEAGRQRVRATAAEPEKEGVA